MIEASVSPITGRVLQGHERILAAARLGYRFARIGSKLYDISDWSKDKFLREAPRRSGVPIYRLFAGGAFDAEHCQAMGTAFEGILLDLDLKRDHPTCEIIAKKIIELAQQGERDPVTLVTLTMRGY
jgi:hypothetical protein